MVDDNDEGGIYQRREGSLYLEMQETDASESVDGTNSGALGIVTAHIDKTESTLLGPEGLLAVPHVKLVLFVVCLLEVREERTERVDQAEMTRPAHAKYQV